jgi:hypothetical protein
MKRGGKHAEFGLSAEGLGEKIEFVLFGMQNRKFGSNLVSNIGCKGLGDRAALCAPTITETNRIDFVLFGMWNRTFGAYLVNIHRMLIPRNARCNPAACDVRWHAE